MRCLIIVREDTGAFAGLSTNDTPFTLKKLGGCDCAVVSSMKRNSVFCDSFAFAVLLKDLEALRSVIGSDDANQLMIIPEQNGDAPVPALASRHFLDETLLIVPAWMTVGDTAAYEERVREAIRLAEEGKIAVFNGIICAKSMVMLTELKELSEDFCNVACKVYESRRSGHNTVRFCGLFMEKFPETTISDVLLCKSDKTVYLPDVKGVKKMEDYGSIYEDSRKDKNGNAGMNIGDTYGVIEFAGSKENLVLTGEKDITLIGVEGLVVVDTGSKLLIAKRGEDIEARLKELDA